MVVHQYEETHTRVRQFEGTNHHLGETLRAIADWAEGESTPTIHAIYITEEGLLEGEDKSYLVAHVVYE